MCAQRGWIEARRKEKNPRNLGVRLKLTIPGSGAVTSSGAEELRVEDGCNLKGHFLIFICLLILDGK